MKIKNNIYYSLDEFKANYEDELSLFQSNFNEANENDFIREQKKLYQIYMNNTRIVKKKDGSIYTVLAIYNESEQIKSILDKFYDPHGNDFKEDKCISMFYGFKNIKVYLESKESITYKEPSKMKPFDNYIIGENILKLQELANNWLEEIEINPTNLLSAFETDNSKKVSINFSKKYTTGIVGNFLNKLHEYYPKYSKKEFVEDISKRIIFTSSRKINPSTKTVMNWM